MRYSCPKCRSNFRFHETDCQWSNIDWHTIEKAYTDLLSVLTRAPQTEHDLADSIHGEWSVIHEAVLGRFQYEGRVESIGQIEQAGQERDVWRLLTADEYREHSKQPSHPDLNAIYEVGPVDGAKDDAVVAMMSYWEMVGLSWEETREAAIQWLRDTGAWDRGSWEERSPEELIDSKKHVYDNSYGWKQAARQAASVIDSNGPTRGEA